MKLELDESYLKSSGVPLNTEDLRLGLSLGLISPLTVVAIAVAAFDRGTADPTMVRLAKAEPDDVATVRSSLRAVDPEDADLFPPDSVRKWIYLELRAAYEIRERLRDPLAFVEQIYADFDYPEAVADFVRYMPPPRGASVGEQALFNRWARYLALEAAELGTQGLST